MEFQEILNEAMKLTPNALLQIYIIAVMLDILTGFLSAKLIGTFTSREATNGLMRQGLRVLYFLALMYIGNVIGDLSASLTLLTTTIQIALIVAYGKSILENYRKIYPKDDEEK